MILGRINPYRTPYAGGKAAYTFLIPLYCVIYSDLCVSDQTRDCSPLIVSLTVKLFETTQSPTRNRGKLFLELL